MNPHYPTVAERAAHRCGYCRAPEATFNFPFEVEHIVPISRQGCDDAANLALACRGCNLLKSDHFTGFDEQNRREVRLFHPRTDRWEDHIRADPVSRAIEGLTAVGRATVACLQMNSAVQLEARRLWTGVNLLLG